MTSHRARIEDAFDAVSSIYAEKAAGRVDRIRRVVAAADAAWAAEGTLSQKAVRAIRSTPAVSCVLVGMRRVEYVSDVLAELSCPIKQDGRLESWRKLTRSLANIAL
jgi:aryl-alcohol dehydrogenase-like predicted oxidoreductase